MSDDMRTFKADIDEMLDDLKDKKFFSAVFIVRTQGEEERELNVISGVSNEITPDIEYGEIIDLLFQAALIVSDNENKPEESKLS